VKTLRKDNYILESRRDTAKKSGSNFHARKALYVSEFGRERVKDARLRAGETLDHNASRSRGLQPFFAKRGSNTRDRNSEEGHGGKKSAEKAKTVSTACARAESTAIPLRKTCPGKHLAFKTRAGEGGTEESTNNKCANQS